MVKHRIVLDFLNASPIYSAPYRAGPKRGDRECVEIAQMENACVAEPAVAEWVSPVVFVSIMDGSLRFRVDFYRNSAVTVRDRYPIPSIDEEFDSLEEARIFLTLDANSGYRQIKINEKT